MRYLVGFLMIFLMISSCSVGDSSELSRVEVPEIEAFDYFESDIPYNNTTYEKNANHDEIAALGRILFYDTKLSLNNSVSCSSCHNQKNGFAENSRFSQGLENYSTRRNSMTLVNNAYQRFHFWEGHSGNIEDHVLSPVSNHIEMGMRDETALVDKLRGIDAYVDRFKQVFDNDPTEDNVNEALSTFIGSLISYNSKFDKGNEVGFTNFSANELAGMDLFFGEAKCGQCHRGDHFAASWRNHANIGLELDYADEGASDGRFKIPSLRNIELTSPYMHDGRFSTLEEVVEHYASGIKDHPELDWTLRNGIELSPVEQEQLVGFLKTLTDYRFIAEKKFSNPFL